MSQGSNWRLRVPDTLFCAVTASIFLEHLQVPPIPPILVDMEEQKLLSVLMPVFNSQRTFAIAVRSTLRAMPKDSELLIAIEGEGLEQYEVEKFSDPRVKVFYLEQKSSVATSLNYLLAQANGQFIARMDADDICLPWRFNMELRHLKKNRLDFVFMNAILFGRSLRPLKFVPQAPLGLKPHSLKLYLAIANPLVHPSMLCRSNSLRALGGYKDTAGEDYELWCRAVQSGHAIARQGFYGIMYRMHPAQLSRTFVNSEKLANAKSEINLSLMRYRDWLAMELDLPEVTDNFDDEVRERLSRISWSNRILLPSESRWRAMLKRALGVV